MTDEEICNAIKNDDEPCDYRAKYDDGKCGIHTEENNQGRPSKFEDVKDDMLEAADGYLNHEQIANAGGVTKQTMYNYFDEHESFFDSFKRERAKAAERLIQKGLDPEDEIDITFVRFLLERSFKFIKTERQEIKSENQHSFDASEGVTAEFVSYEEATNGSD